MSLSSMCCGVLGLLFPWNTHVFKTPGLTCLHRYSQSAQVYMNERGMIIWLLDLHFPNIEYLFKVDISVEPIERLWNSDSRIEVTTINVALARHNGSAVRLCEPSAAHLAASPTVATIVDNMVSVFPRPMTSAIIPPVAYEGMLSFGGISATRRKCFCASWYQLISSRFWMNPKALTWWLEIC